MRPISKFVQSTVSGERARFMTMKVPPKLIRLDSGSPAFATPVHIRDAVKRALDEGHTGYIMEQGVAALQEAICEQIAQETGVTYSPGQVLVTNGASSGIYAVMTCLLDPGDEVIVFNPCYSLTAHVAKQLGAVPVYVDHTADYQLNTDALRAAFTPRTRIVYLNNPNNPTGMVYRREAIAAVVKLAAERNVIVLGDEAYAKLLQPGEVHVPLLSFGADRDQRDHLILAGSLSKAYAMTGFRLGYVVAPPDLIETIYGAHRAINGPICTFVQYAGIAALRGPQDCIAQFNREYDRHAAILLKHARDVPGLHPAMPQGAFYMWCRYDQPIPAAELFVRMVERGVVVRTGSEFGSAGEHHIRLSYSVSQSDIEQGMAIVREVMGELMTEPQRAG